MRNFKIAGIGIAFLKHANFINFKTLQSSLCAKKNVEELADVFMLLPRIFMVFTKQNNFRTQNKAQK